MIQILFPTGKTFSAVDVPGLPELTCEQPLVRASFINDGKTRYKLY